MTRFQLALPRDIPWKVLAVSPDMMDVEFCNKEFPVAWKTSLAVSAFEPSLDEMPEELCDQRLTFLKVTCSITGYEPSKKETDDGYAIFSGASKEQITRIFKEYFACYGVLLNVAVFPGPDSGTHTAKKRVAIDFRNDPVNGNLPNPLTREGASFDQPNAPAHDLVDLFPAGGDGSAELSIGQQLVVSIPATWRVEATVAHTAGPVTMDAYAGSTLVGSRQTGPQQGQGHLLELEGQDIDRVVLTAPQNEASVVDFAYWVREQRPAKVADYPHIIEFEPKMRDLYQAATESGEVLTASVGSVGTDKTLAHTESTETGLSLGAKYQTPETPYGKAEVSGSLSHKWGETNEDTRTVNTDASRERRERQGTSTTLSQLYNLLTGYHVGTNRAVFLMLPRPHVLQPTDRRTFVQGLRMIEGVQDFFLIASRPSASEGLCVEAWLDTGHFPEKVDKTEPPVEYAESSEEFTVTAYAKGGGGITGHGAETKAIESFSGSTYTVASGWVVDKRPGIGDAGHPGVSEIGNASNSQANSSLKSYNYQANSDASVQVSGTISGANWWGAGAIFDRTYRVFTRSEQPKPTTDAPAVTTPFLITSRGLCLCMRSADPCVEVVTSGVPGGKVGDWIVDEVRVPIDADVLRSATSVSKLPAQKELLRQIHSAMATSWRMPTRRPLGDVGFLESDYFRDRVMQELSDEALNRPVGAVLPRRAARELGEQSALKDVLKLDLSDLAELAGVPIGEAAGLRRSLLEATSAVGGTWQDTHKRETEAE